MKEINGELSAKGLKIAVVVSRFNSFLTEQLLKGAVDAFTRLGGAEKDLTLVRVPGAYEIPLVAARLAAGKVDAVVCLGAVVQGATAHADLINQATAKSFSEISVASGVPVLDGIVAAENLEQAVERCGTKQGNKGFAAMQSAVEMANVMLKLRG
ncbi:MAG: 6,7-dimethyl-8-ribityllumazine synthase [Kiritimatiellae bacterium]|nr:6,7-dimethyl-8-ribityllumazine synthase [Kiritimatiellia bacterium]